MKINNLKPGTKLMWDAPPIKEGNPRIVYPALITEQHHNKTFVKVLTGRTSNWMGPDSEFLRQPTVDELNTLTWPTISYI